MMPRQSKSPSRSRSANTTSIKFCHYKNGMYMGQMKCFEKQGRGIVLLDSGEVAVASYQKDKLNGETTLFSKSNQIYSLTFDHNIILQLAAKDNSKLIFVKFKHGVPEGKLTMIDFESKQIVYCIFKQGKIIGKTFQQDNVFLNRVFYHNNLSSLIPIHHLKSLDFQIKAPYLEIIKRNSSITVGFHKQGFINGLGFILFKDPQREKGWFQMIQKGYYKDSQLFGIGEKRYQNGNIYIGQFKSNIFQGRGLLVNTEKNNWVKGVFKEGNMIDMIQYSNQVNSQHPKASQMLATLHKKKSSWVNNDIRFHKDLDFNAFFNRVTRQCKEHIDDGVLDFQQRKVMALKKIQDNFIPNNSSINIFKQSTPVKSATMTFNDTSEKKGLTPFQISSSRQKSIIKLFPSSNKSSRVKNVSFKKPGVIKALNKSQISEISSEKQQTSNKWKNNTNQIPINIYTFQESIPSLLQQQERQVQETFSSRLKYNLSVHSPSASQIRQSKRSISGSRRHRIFDQSPSHLKVISQSRMNNNPSPLKSSIRDSKFMGQSSASQVLQQIGQPIKRSRKIVKSRILQQDPINEEQQPPTFRYSRFRTEQQVFNNTRKDKMI